LEWTVPTLGFNVESIKLKNNIVLQGWDLGGGWVNQKMFHHHYCEQVKVLVWVIDVIDFDRIQVIKQYFDESLVHEKLKDPIIVVLLNKIDLAESASKT
jgi:GTPase SAR1 family protein